MNSNDVDHFFYTSIGLSCRTQEVYLIVFLVRYADLFMYYVSAYNTMMKIFFISSTAFIIYLMRFKKPFCSVSTILSITQYMGLLRAAKMTRYLIFFQ